MPLTALPRHHKREGGAACTARTVRSWSPDARLTESFAAYGDDASGADDGTGDGTHSVRLPDGRVLWLFSDTCLGQVYAPPNPVGEPYARQDTSAPLVRNAAVVMHDGHLQLTLPAPLFPDPAPNEWRRPVAARVEPRSPAHPSRSYTCCCGRGRRGPYPWIYGVPITTSTGWTRGPLRPRRTSAGTCRCTDRGS